jgi:hypothetical protein
VTCRGTVLGMPEAMQLKNVVFLLLVACGDKGDKEWTQRATPTVHKTIGGVGFSIDLPEGMRERLERDELHYDFVVKHNGEDYVKPLEIYVSTTTSAKPTLDEELKSPLYSPTTVWVRKDSLPDGYILDYEANKDTYWVERTILGSPSLQCRFLVRAWDRGDNVKDKLPQAEKVCLSMKRDK